MNTKELAKKYNVDLNKRDIVFELSHLITVARSYAGISQLELAKRIGTKQPGIARAESGEVEPSVTFLDKIARAVGAELTLPHFSFQKSEKTEIPTVSHKVFNDFSLPSALFPITIPNRSRTEALIISFN